MSALRRARDEVRIVQTRLRSRSLDEPTVKDIGRAIDRVAAQTSIGGDLASLTMRSAGSDNPAIRPEELRRGVKVFVPKLAAEAEVLEVLPGGQVRVAMGALKLTVTPGEIRAATPGDPADARRGPKPGGGRRDTPGDGRATLLAPIQMSDNTCDVRGLRSDDAVAMVIAFLDRSVHDGRQVAFLIHGHGTGALRDAIRRELKASRYVTHFRPGETGEGGDGVTVVWMQ
jgi:DNA mismatch repair protein MutS2